MVMQYSVTRRRFGNRDPSESFRELPYINSREMFKDFMNTRKFSFIRLTYDSSENVIYYLDDRDGTILTRAVLTSEVDRILVGEYLHDTKSAYFMAPNHVGEFEEKLEYCKKEVVKREINDIERGKYDEGLFVKKVEGAGYNLWIRFLKWFHDPDCEHYPRTNSGYEFIDFNKTEREAEEKVDMDRENRELKDKVEKLEKIVATFLPDDDDEIELAFLKKKVAKLEEKKTRDSTIEGTKRELIEKLVNALTVSNDKETNK